MTGHVTSLSPLQVQPKGAQSGRPVQLKLSHVSTAGWTVGDRVLVEVQDGYLILVGKLVAP